MYKIMTAGPTQVRKNVLEARSLPFTNPDIDLEFYEFYKETCDLLSKLLHSSSPSFILGGEGILGLEAACASLTEPGDKVLVIDNGIFGKGFADFIKLYGGDPVLYTSDYHKPVDLDDLKGFLEENSDFKYATVVHCDTPSGVINDVHKICPLLKSYNILTVVDSVAGMFGEYVNFDEGQFDILCGGSQKALSCPPGLTMITVSEDAITSMKSRKAPIASYYANILNYIDYYDVKWFPYTMPISDIKGFRVALENVAKEKDIVERHKRIAQATRKALVASGLELYLESGYSNNVTVLNVPEGIDSDDILADLKDSHNIMISGCFDILAGKVLRIGHMGENANVADMEAVLSALGETMKKLGFPVKADMAAVFRENL